MRLLLLFWGGMICDTLILFVIQKDMVQISSLEISSIGFIILFTYLISTILVNAKQDEISSNEEKLQDIAKCYNINGRIK